MTIGENIQKYWKYYAIVTALVSIVGWVYLQGGIQQEKDQRLFKTYELRYETEKYMEEIPSAKQEQQAYFRDSVNTANAIKSRNFRDSTYKEEIKARKIETKKREKTDSIVLLNADQMYQIKEILKKGQN